jgi:hypothetical protein
MDDENLKKVLELILQMKNSYGVSCDLIMEWYCDDDAKSTCRYNFKIPGAALIRCENLEWILDKSDDIEKCIECLLDLQEAAENLKKYIERLQY